MGYAAKLVVREVSPADAVSKVAVLLKPPQRIPPPVVTAGAHSISYSYHSEIRFGPALYSATVVGPMGSAISRQLDNRLFLAPRSPYQLRLGLYAFAEWRGDLGGQGSSVVRIFDLAVGELVASQVMKFADFVGWRGGISGEYIVQEYGLNQSSDWWACDARAGGILSRHLWKTKRLLFRGGFEGHISADGNYLLVLRTRADVFVALISIDSALVLDLKKAADFLSYVHNVIGLDTVSFDPQSICLTSMLNWANTDYQASRVTFEKLITIEVGAGTKPGS